ncbi:MAG TPA: asparagine synthase (glutamine-hydrolyzing) [Candidatus Paceibacterota bacterium]|nr:asparagine synthase (glutamine-hydrolyzing) [Candidatus Paceibacterota bacterium]
MCGIAGYAGSGKADLPAMLGAIRHRGPDHQGIFERAGAHFAHARLSIIDPSAGASQPMELGQTALMFNGEIYNFKALREEFEKLGAKFKTNSDTEVILWGYQLLGEEVFARLEGMFAIAIYDFAKERLLLARDRMGEKPLYWSSQGGLLLFASELKAMLASGAVKKEVDLESVNQYLLFDYVPIPYSMVKGVSKLEPATMLAFENGKLRKKRFWSPTPAVEAVDFDSAKRKLGQHIEKSVGDELVAADVPVGVFLSGGIDSSTVAYYAQKNSSRPIDTFSIGFDDPSFDESMFARAVAQRIGSRHHEKIVTAKDALELVPNLAEPLSEPAADASIIPTMLLSKFARESVTVALGGDGGDELFAGYPTFKAERYISLYRQMPGFAKAAAHGFADLLPASHGHFPLSYTLRKFLSATHDDQTKRHMEWLGSYPEAARLAIANNALRDVVAKKNVFEHLGSYEKEMAMQDPGNRLLWIYARSFLMDQVMAKVDRASMHYALETRAPFLNHPVVDYAFSLPYRFKQKGNTSKYILKELMRGKLPDTVVSRKKKGFGIPLASWLSGPLRPLCEELLSPASLDAHGLFDPAEARQLMDEHFAKKRDNRKELWNLMVFQLWYQRWMK